MILVYCMNTMSNLVTDSLEFYDSNKEKYESFLSNIKYINLGANYDRKYHEINLLDKNKKIIHTSRYEILGVLDTVNNIWLWAWAAPYLPKNLTYISRKILHYGTELESESEFLKTELITSRFKISGPIQVELHTAIASYLSKQPFIIDISVSGKEYSEYNPKEKSKEKSYYLFLLDLPELV